MTKLFFGGIAAALFVWCGFSVEAPRAPVSVENYQTVTMIAAR